MNLTEIFIIALSLSLDCFAVSISSGGTMKILNIKNMIKMAFFFGFFQSIMPIIGYFAGKGISVYIEKFDHWVAFTLLFIIGAKMIYESYQIDELGCLKNDKCPFGFQTLTLLAIATSIDALAIGITFSILNSSIVLPVIIIGIVSFIMSVIGINMGYKGKNFFENKMEKIAGIILIILGGKILLENLL
ncbi:MAG: manganese efflux pump MntP family protein [Elusimicrobiota bacterium]